MKITDEYVFFYKDWLSNYQKTKFKFDINFDKLQNHDYLERTDITIYEFTSTEQGFMYYKALYFDNQELADEILNEPNPDKCRRMGRQVKRYDDTKWSKIRYEVFYRLNLAKYTQDLILQKKLLDSKFDNKKFVEASPIDRIWGVGYDENRAEYNEHNWGRNYLGKILTNIRNRIKQNKLDDMNWNIYTYSGKNEKETNNI